MINDPHLDGSGDVGTGLRLARRLLLEVSSSACRRQRVPRPDHAAVRRRRGRVGRDRRAHDREPDPPSARLRPVDARRLQERHRRQRRGRRRCGAPPRSRMRSRHRRQGRAGDPGHARKPRLPHHPARRARRDRTTTSADVAAVRERCGRPACPSGSSSTPRTTTAARTTSASRSSPPTSPRRSPAATRHRRRDARVVHRRRPAGPRARREPPRRVDHRRLHDWKITVECSRTSPRRSDAPRRAATSAHADAGVVARSRADILATPSISRRGTRRGTEGRRDAGPAHRARVERRAGDLQLGDGRRARIPRRRAPLRRSRRRRAPSAGRAGPWGPTQRCCGGRRSAAPRCRSATARRLAEDVDDERVEAQSRARRRSCASRPRGAAPASRRALTVAS